MVILSTAHTPQTSMQDLSQLSFSPVYVPASKLDADQYMAQDIDGVTESLFGSGNLNFLMLQAGQSNDLLSTTSPFLLTGEGDFPSSAVMSTNDFGSASPAFSNNGVYDSESALEGGGQSLQLLHTELDDAPATSDTTPIETHSPGGSGVAVTYDDLAASNGFAGVSNHGLDGDDGSVTTHVIVEPSIIEGILDNIINIEDVTNIVNTEDITTTVTEAVTNITDVVNNVVDNIFNLIGELENGLTLNLDAVLSEVLTLDASLLQGDNITQLVDQVLDLTPLTDHLDGIVDLSGLDPADISSSIGLLGGDPQARDPNQDIDLGLDVTGNLGDLELIDSLTDVVVDPVEDIVGDIDVLGDVGLNLLNNEGIDNASGDTDLAVNSDLDLLDSNLTDLNVDVPLDFVESVTGDIDLELDVAGDILSGSADNMVDALPGGSVVDNAVSEIGDNVQEMAGDIIDEILPDFAEDGVAGGNLDLLNTDSINNADGDTDINVGLDLELIDTEIADLDLPEINLDTVEAITGDIDLDVNAALNVLDSDPVDGDFIDDVLGSGIGTVDDIAGDWTETILPGGDDLGGDAFGGMLDTVLPDPVGTVAEGIGNLLPGGDDASAGGSLLGGGLFG